MNAVVNRIVSLVAFSVVTGKAFSQLNPLSIGTIAAGDSIVVYYDVTINTGCGCSQISNQGTVSATNVATFSTDDPKTGALNDPTITVLNLFPLPVTLLEFRGNQSDRKIELSWKANEGNVHHYEIERNTTGATFAKIGSVQAIGSGQRSYNFTDANPISVAYYRLKIVDVDGKINYSSVLKFAGNATDQSFAVYPNPVLNSQITIQLSNFSAGRYAVVFYNSIGQQVIANVISHAGGSAITLFRLPKTMGKGLYTVTVKGREQTYTQKLLIGE